uniref:Uncharacterized protein n=1 Tax=Timema douglasi TaxID=61478 RepID=A0A7R8VPP5_TIMDO|nr:unnamed protein product [Timema douglasi]
MTTIVFNTPVTYNRVVYPIWAIALGWLSAVLSMMFIPGYIVYKLATSSGDCLKARCFRSISFFSISRSSINVHAIALKRSRLTLTGCTMVQIIG